MNMVDKDYIIVGSGPGGAMVAKDLSQRKKKVLILEWGDNNPLTGSFWWGAKSFLCPGRSLLFTPQMLGLVRGIFGNMKQTNWVCWPQTGYLNILRAMY